MACTNSSRFLQIPGMAIVVESGIVVSSTIASPKTGTQTLHLTFSAQSHETTLCAHLFQSTFQQDTTIRPQGWPIHSERREQDKVQGAKPPSRWMFQMLTKGARSTSCRTRASRFRAMPKLIGCKCADHEHSNLRAAFLAKGKDIAMRMRRGHNPSPPIRQWALPADSPPFGRAFSVF